MKDVNIKDVGGSSYYNQSWVKWDGTASSDADLWNKWNGTCTKKGNGKGQGGGNNASSYTDQASCESHSFWPGLSRSQHDASRKTVLGPAICSPPETGYSKRTDMLEISAGSGHRSKVAHFSDITIPPRLRGDERE